VISAANTADQIFAGSDSSSNVERPVFVTGMARSGTTLLLELLHGTGAFTSLTYRNMPFVTAPLLWKRMSTLFMQKGKSRERAHGDGLEVSFDSPEAFEEVFWRGLLSDAQIRPGWLEPQASVSSSSQEAFRNFVARVLVSGSPDRRYLSKNNMNLLRLGALRDTFPDAVILVPFRDPEAYVRSVLSQHERFLESQASDPFVRLYMCWLGHFEFGVDFRPLLLPGVQKYNSPVEALGRDYLLRYWTAVHSWLLEQSPAGILLFDHNRLRETPETSLAALSEVVGVEKADFPAEMVRKGAHVAAPEAPDELEEAAWAIFERLKKASI
jgi:hypothetical protein